MRNGLAGRLPRPYADKVTSLRPLIGELTAEIIMLTPVTADLLAGDRVLPGDPAATRHRPGCTRATHCRPSAGRWRSPAAPGRRGADPRAARGEDRIGLHEPRPCTSRVHPHTEPGGRARPLEAAGHGPAQDCDGPFLDLPPANSFPSASALLRTWGQISVVPARPRGESHSQMEGFQAEGGPTPYPHSALYAPASNVICSAPGNPVQTLRSLTCRNVYLSQT